MKKSENVQNQLEAQKNMLEKLSKTLDDQNKEISRLTSLIDKQNKFIKAMGGKLEKNDNKKSFQNKIHESKKTNYSNPLQDFIAATASEISEKDNRISKLKKVIDNNANNILSLVTSSNQKFSADYVLKIFTLIPDRPSDDKAVCDFIKACKDKLNPCALLTILQKWNQSDIQCIYKSNEKEVFGFKFNLLSCGCENGNKSIFRNQLQPSWQFYSDIPSCDNQDYKLDEDEK